MAILRAWVPTSGSQKKVQVRGRHKLRVYPRGTAVAENALPMQASLSLATLLVVDRPEDFHRTNLCSRAPVLHLTAAMARHGSTWLQGKLVRNFGSCRVKPWAPPQSFFPAPTVTSELNGVWRTQPLQTRLAWCSRCSRSE